MTFSDLHDAEFAVLNPLLANGRKLAGVAVVREDVADLNTEILQAMSSVGLMILLGTPPFDNSKGNTGPLVVAGVRQQILIGEVPAVWRNADDTKIHCQDAALVVAASLQGLLLPNKQYLSVTGGTPLGTFKGEMKKTESVFQYYRLELEVAMTFSAA